MAVPCLLSFQSCKKEGNTATSTLGQATITGRITGDIDLTSGKKDGLSGVKVIARINFSDLSTSSAPSGVKVYEATTNADGYYTLKVDAGSKVVNAMLELPNKINLEQTKEDGSKEVVEFMINGSASRTVTLYKGQTKTENEEYTSEKSLPIGLVTIKGKVEYRNDLCEADPDDQVSKVPSGTKLVITWTDDDSESREVVINVKSDGTYEFSVESKSASKTIKVRGLKFFADQKYDDGGDCKTEVDYGYTTVTTSSTVNKNETNIEDIIFE